MQALLCFSHLRWHFVYQRPQHLMSRFARTYRLYYFEEPIVDVKDDYSVSVDQEVSIVKIYLKDGLDERNSRLRTLIDEFIAQNAIADYVCWYYTPMALEYTAHLRPSYIIYDCMDELSAFRFAPSNLLTLENTLFERADIVFTGGNSLYQAKESRHHNIHAFPSSIDKAHFGQARYILDDTEDQSDIPHPRFGFYGVIDERFDIELLREVALKRPDWQFVIIGPVVKISESELPAANNIHYLGSKKYEELPAYISQWDVAMVLFAINESTEFISPTKTPEYLAAGLPVISTPIKDIVTTYGVAGLAHIANHGDDFIEYGEMELKKNDRKEWLDRVDEFLKDDSWDITFGKMNTLIDKLKN